MIWHETIGEDGEFVSAAPFREEREIEQIVVVTEKSRLPSVASLCDMVSLIGNDHPRQSRHSISFTYCVL